jgi:hypothetical protein
MSKLNEAMKLGTWGRNTRLLVLAVAALASAGSAHAQATCDAGEPWVLNGSDTLETMVRQAIVNATSDGTLASCGLRCQTSNSLLYNGHCSVTTTKACVGVQTGPVATSQVGIAAAQVCPTGETCNRDATQLACTAGTADSCTAYGASGFPAPFCATTSELFYAGGGSTTGEDNLNGNLQTLAPMSRALRDTRIFTAAGGTTRRAFCANTGVACTPGATACGAPTSGDTCVVRSWDLIYPRNVVALDAAVIVTKQGGVKNFQLPIVGTDESQTSVPVGSTPYTFLAEGSGYNQILATVLAGVDGSGSFEACSDPRRITAVQDLASAQNGGGTIKHFYRRDDNSGTQDTIKERLRISRFCNGRSVGVNGSNKANPNLNNMDYDPIRRPCEAPGTTQRETSCTDVVAIPPQPCKASDNNPNCTQGLVVALSIGDNDTTLSDVTDSIGARVNADGTNFGFAGLSAVGPAFLNSGPTIRTRSTGKGSVRLGSYMLSRRLFINYADWDGDSGTSDATFGPGGTSNLPGTANTARVDAEGRLWNWLTTDRNNFDPIVIEKKFITCMDDATVSPCGDSGNICCFPNPAPLFGGSPSACVPGSGSGGTRFWPIDDGNATTNLGGSIAAATSAQTCCSDLTVIPANTAGTCPEVPKRAVNFACAKDSDCAGIPGVTAICADGSSIGITTCQ